MTKKAWIALDVEGQPLTLNELNRLLFDLLEAQEAQPEALSPQLWSTLRRNVEWQLIQFRRTQKDNDQTRWFYVGRGLERGLGWDGAYEFASKALKHGPAAGSPATMKASYQKFEKGLPPEKRRKRTYRPQS